MQSSAVRMANEYQHTRLALPGVLVKRREADEKRSRIGQSANLDKFASKIMMPLARFVIVACQAASLLQHLRSGLHHTMFA